MSPIGLRVTEMGFGSVVFDASVFKIVLISLKPVKKIWSLLNSLRCHGLEGSSLFWDRVGFIMFF